MLAIDEEQATGGLLIIVYVFSTFAIIFMPVIKLIIKDISKWLSR